MYVKIGDCDVIENVIFLSYRFSDLVCCFLYIICISLYSFFAHVGLAPSLEASGNSDLSSCDQ